MLKHFIGVSVIIPFYKEVNWLLEAIESVYSQSFKNFEIIVINDGSQEDITVIYDRFPQVKIITIHNSGPGKARNEGIKVAEGEFIAFLDSDDLWKSNKLELQFKYMKDNNYYWSHSNYERFWSHGFKSEIIYCDSMQGNIMPKIFLTCPIATPCIMINRSILMNDHTLRFSEKIRVGEDSYFWFKLAEKYPLGFIDLALCRVRMRGKNAASQAYLQLKARVDAWSFIKKMKAEKSKNGLNFFISFGYILCKIGYDFVIFFNLKRKSREILSKIVYLVPYVYFKIISKFYN